MQAGATVVRELSSLVERGHDIGPGDDRVGGARAGERGVAVGRARGRRVAPPQPPRRPEVGQPEALRGRHPARDGDVRRRPGRHGQDVPGDRHGHRRAVAARGQPDHPHAPRRGGGRAARLPAGRPDGQGRPVPAPAVRRDARHDGRRARGLAPGEGRDRGRAAGLHARPHAQRLVRDPRRGAEHDARADEDVPHPARVRLADGRHRRRHAGRPAARPEVRADRGRGHPRGHRGRRVRALRRRRRGPPQARAADRRGLRRARRRPAEAAAATSGAARPRVARGGRDRQRAAGRRAWRRRSATRPPPRGSRTATSRSSSSTPSGSPSSTREWRGKAGPTDVLSFPVDEDDEDRRSASASWATCSSARSTPTDLVEAVVHGVLHLTGMDHETDEGEMLALQAEIMAWLR